MLARDLDFPNTRVLRLDLQKKKCRRPKARHYEPCSRAPFYQVVLVPADRNPYQNAEQIGNATEWGG